MLTDLAKEPLVAHVATLGLAGFAQFCGFSIHFVVDEIAKEIGEAVSGELARAGGGCGQAARDGAVDFECVVIGAFRWGELDDGDGEAVPPGHIADAI